jgi:cell filamentation protein
MTDHGYDAIKDPYCYDGSRVLRNKLNIREQDKLDAAERQLTRLRFEEPLPSGTLDVMHYCAINHHLFQDTFAWAGKFRTVRISKGASVFCYPEFISNEMQSLFTDFETGILKERLGRQAFANRAANFLASLNAIHPFREGNGRTQLVFLAVLSEHMGHPLNMKMFNPERLLASMITSFQGDVVSLASEIMGEEN